MKKHICIFLAFQNFDDIKMSFDSMYHDEVDFFVVENKSENSKEIEEYFLTKKLIGYIQFEENIAAKAITIFIKNFYDLLSSYEYITITDGDLYVLDIKDAFTEILNNFNAYSNVMISSIMTFEENKLPSKKNHYKGERILGIENYFKKMELRKDIKHGAIRENTGGWLLTLKNKTLPLIKDMYFIDWDIYKKVVANGGMWVRTVKNLAYHLTWDKHVENNEYYSWKKNEFPGWQHYKDKACKYRKIV